MLRFGKRNLAKEESYRASKPTKISDTDVNDTVYQN